MSRIALGLSLLALFSGVVARASAQNAPNTVVMVVDPSVLPIARRLTQEIESLGLVVRLIAAKSSDAPVRRDRALASGAVAEIHLAPVDDAGGDVDMIILDGATGRTVDWKVPGPTAAEPTPLDLIATRTVELLRASLLELAARREAAAREQRTRAPPEPPPALPAPEAEARFSLATGPALLYSAHLRPGVLLQSSAVWLPFRSFGVSASALLPLAAADLETAEGTVDLLPSLYRLAPVFVAGGASAAVSLRCAAGVELDWLRFQGSAIAPYHSAQVTRRAWAPFASATTRFRAAHGFYVFTELSAAFAYPRTVLRVADRELTNWGRPLGTAAFGIELTWPTEAPR